MTRAWQIKPSPFIGLLILIALLHIVENLVQSTIRVIKILAIALLIILKLKGGGSGARYISESFNVILAAIYSSVNSNASPQSSLESSIWSALANRAKDVALYAFGQLSKYPLTEWIEKKSREDSEKPEDNSIDETAKPDTKASDQ